MSRKRTARPAGRPQTPRPVEDCDAPLTAPLGLRVLERVYCPKPVPFRLTVPDMLWVLRRLEGRSLPEGTVYRWLNHGLRLRDGTHITLPAYKAAVQFVLAEDFEAFLAMRSGTDVPVKLPQDVADAATKAGRKLEAMGV